MQNVGIIAQRRVRVWGIGCLIWGVGCRVQGGVWG